MMELYANLPLEWRGKLCPGNGHGCGALLRDDSGWESINSCLVVRRSCHYGHSAEATIPVEIPERPFTKNARGHAIIDPKPKNCVECDSVFIPYSSKHDFCKSKKCRAYRDKRTMYLKGLWQRGMDRSEAKIKALEYYPRMKNKWVDTLKPLIDTNKALAILTGVEEGR